MWRQKKLVDYCKEKGIVVTAFSPLGAKGNSWGTNSVMDNEILKEIAEAHGKTVAQVCYFQTFEKSSAFDLENLHYFSSLVTLVESSFTAHKS